MDAVMRKAMRKEITMLRACVSVLTVLAPVLLLLAATGCEPKTVTVQQTEERHETTPKMVSPGEEVVE